jgi:hypothetical protein
MRVENDDCDDYTTGSMNTTPADVLLEVSMSHAIPRCLHVVADLGIADALDDVPRTAEELAAATGTHANALHRVLRALSAFKIFQANGAGWMHTPASRLLRSDHPQSMRSFVRMIGMPMYWEVFKSLEYTVRTGLSAGEKLVPGGLWGYLAADPERNRIFNEAMIGKAHAQIAGIIRAYDFSGYKSIADIGGGHGHLLQAVLAAAPQAKGILFDQPHVVEQVSKIASDQLRLQAGDFFKDGLPVCDAYLIMQVIHDWNDDQALTILKGIRRAAPEGAKLLLIEAIIPEGSDPNWVTSMDLQMLTLLTGRERTEQEYKALLAAAGFRLNRSIEVGLQTAILESTAM